MSKGRPAEDHEIHIDVGGEGFHMGERFDGLIGRGLHEVRGFRDALNLNVNYEKFKGQRCPEDATCECGVGLGEHCLGCPKDFAHLY